MKSTALAAMLTLATQAIDYNTDPCTHDSLACWNWHAAVNQNRDIHFPLLGSYAAGKYYTIHPGTTAGTIDVELKRSRCNDVTVRLEVQAKGSNYGKL